MICPNCRVDIEEYNRKTKEEFEKRFGAELKPYRRWARIKSFLWGFVTSCIIAIFFKSESLNPVEGFIKLKSLVLQPTGELAIMILGIAVLTVMTSGNWFYRAPKKEKQLWSDFCAARPIK